MKTERSQCQVMIEDYDRRISGPHVFRGAYISHHGRELSAADITSMRGDEYFNSWTNAPRSNAVFVELDDQLVQIWAEGRALCHATRSWWWTDKYSEEQKLQLALITMHYVSPKPREPRTRIYAIDESSGEMILDVEIEIWPACHATFYRSEMISFGRKFDLRGLTRNTLEVRRRIELHGVTDDSSTTHASYPTSADAPVIIAPY